VSTPTTEPTQVRAGDSWAWRREDLGAYPATAWSLAYWFKNAAGGFQVAAAADGDAFAVALGSDDTQDLAAGSYSWQARVTKIADPSEKHTVASGTLQLLASLFVGAAADPLDNRSHARKMLDAIEAKLENRVPADRESYAIYNREIKHTPIAELVVMRDKYASMVRSEESAERLAAGLPSRNKLHVRF